MNSPVKTIAVSGANGYIGYKLCRALHDAGYRVTPLVRVCADSQDPRWQGLQPVVEIDDYTRFGTWNKVLADIDCVIHAAGAAHLTDGKDYPVSQGLVDERMKSANYDATRVFADSASSAGVKKFLFLSSASVYGTDSEDKLLTEASQCKPETQYGLSKLEAERYLQSLGDNKEDPKATTMEIAILRLPMVYGPQCPGNLSRLAALLHRGFPLPLKAIDSRRHLLGVENFCDFVITAIQTEHTIKGIWNVTDKDDIDFHTIVDALYRGMNVKNRLFAVPLPLLLTLAGAAGRRDAIEKLCTSVRMDNSKAMNTLGWTAPDSTFEGLEAFGREFAKHAS